MQGKQISRDRSTTIPQKEKTIILTLKQKRRRSEDIAIGAGGLRFDSRAGQIEERRQRPATAATLLCCPGAMMQSRAPPLVTRCDVIPRVFLKIYLIYLQKRLVHQPYLRGRLGLGKS